MSDKVKQVFEKHSENKVSAWRLATKLMTLDQFRAALEEIMSTESLRSKYEIQSRLDELNKANKDPLNPSYGLLHNHIKELEWVLNKR